MTKAFVYNDPNTLQVFVLLEVIEPLDLKNGIASSEVFPLHSSEISYCTGPISNSSRIIPMVEYNSFLTSFHASCLFRIRFTVSFYTRLEFTNITTSKQRRIKETLVEFFGISSLSSLSISPKLLHFITKHYIIKTIFPSALNSIPFTLHTPLHITQLWPQKNPPSHK